MHYDLRMAWIHRGGRERCQQLGLTIVGVMHNNVIFQLHPRRRLPRPASAGAVLLAIMMAATGCGSSSPSKSASTHSSTATSAQQRTAPASTATSTSGSQPSAPAAPAAAGVVTGAAGAVTATLHAGTHHPKVNQAWPIRFTVSSSGRAAKASVSYEYLFGGQVVAHRSHYTFTGHFSDVFRWPSSAVGYPLTFRAVIVSGGATIDLDYPVQVVA